MPHHTTPGASMRYAAAAFVMANTSTSIRLSPLEKMKQMSSSDKQICERCCDGVTVSVNRSCASLLEAVPCQSVAQSMQMQKICILEAIQFGVCFKGKPYTKRCSRWRTQFPVCQVQGHFHPTARFANGHWIAVRFTKNQGHAQIFAGAIDTYSPPVSDCDAAKALL